MDKTPQMTLATPKSEEVIVMLTLKFKPGTVATVLESVIPSVRLTRAEPGNNAFDVFKAKGSEDELVIFERWKSQSALEEHWEQPYTQEALKLFDENLLKPLVDGEDVLYFDDLAK